MSSNQESEETREDKTEQVDTLDMLVEKTKEEAGLGQDWCVEMVRGPMIGERVFLKEGKLTFGRASECDIFLDDITVSRNHCEIFLKDGQVVVKDSGSTNGTYVGSKAVEEQNLEAGDVIQIGRYVFLLTRRSAQ
ncbi:MAG TPA: FHA domain-containing protein [Acidimicrobiia bacterium]|nr:FHA domain-containing protein [Acidimicrobiia bacterium]